MSVKYAKNALATGAHPRTPLWVVFSPRGAPNYDTKITKIEYKGRFEITLIWIL